MDKPTFLYRLWPAIATVTPTNSLAGYTPGDILAATEDTSHRFTGAGNNAYVIDAGSAIIADCFAILGAEIDGLVLDIAGSANGTDWTAVLADETLVASPLAAWGSFTSAEYRYWRLTFASAPSNMEIAHLCLCQCPAWPWFESDWDVDNLKVEGSALLSSSGYFAGGTTQSVMREMPINPGAVTAAEYLPIKAFADAVIRYKRGVFFVPDVSDATVFFGYMDDDSFSAPYRNGMREVSALKFVTRAV